MGKKFHLETIGSFFDQVAAKTPTPGGGTAAAMMGALGASLGVMACRFTTGEKFKAHAAEMETAANSLLSVRDQLIPLMEADALAYDRVSEALALPKENDEQKKSRMEALHASLKGAMEIPLHTMDLSFRALQILQRHSADMNANLASDLASASLALVASVQSAWLNIQINKTALGDDPEGERMKAEADKIRKEATELSAALLQKVDEAFE